MYLNDPDATTQGLYDTVVNHLFTQKQRAVDADGRCVYRTPDGLSCAAGCLVSPSDYDPRMDRDRLSAHSVADLLGVHDAPDQDHGLVALVSELQRVHDDVGSWNDAGPSISMLEKLDVIATRFSLDVTVLRQRALAHHERDAVSAGLYP